MKMDVERKISYIQNTIHLVIFHPVELFQVTYVPQLTDLVCIVLAASDLPDCTFVHTAYEFHGKLNDWLNGVLLRFQYFLSHDSKFKSVDML